MLTKKIHNLIHGSGEPGFTDEERNHYEETNKANAEELLPLLSKNDILIINDPQPMGMAKFIQGKIDVTTIWRSHIGLDQELPQTKSAWEFLHPYADAYDIAVFSAEEYIPNYFREKAAIIFPSIDPLDHKNRDLILHKTVGILCNANLVHEHQPVLTAPFTHFAKRLQPDGSFSSALLPEEIGLMFRPIITQVSRWDRLKGFQPLMEGFALLKQELKKFAQNDLRHQRRLELTRLVLAGPDPDFVSDDPEGKEVLEELTNVYLSLPPSIQHDISIVKLPMDSRKENALIVNALQRSSTIVVQNSIQEGFGLTATEAMWKKIPVMASNACGLRKQVRENVDGKIVQEPGNPKNIAEVLNIMLQDYKCREVWGHHGQRNAIEKFLVFSQIEGWLDLFDNLMVRSDKSDKEKILDF